MAAGIGRGAEVARAGREISLEVLGLRLAALRYGDAASPHKVALVHGWMDNAGSWGACGGVRGRGASAGARFRTARDAVFRGPVARGEAVF
jgi:hypothetical protein